MTDDIGNRLRAARIAQGMSLRSVATSLGLSASLLSQVETGKSQPSVSTLYAIVNHLGLSFDDLMYGGGGGGRQTAVESLPRPTVHTPGGPLQRNSDNPVLEIENGVRWERLASTRGGSVDPMRVTYLPGASSSVEGRMTRHSGVEYAYLLSGELTLRIDFDSFVIHPGDSLMLDSVRPHLYVNESTEPATGIWFVVGRREFSEQMPDSGMPERPVSNLTSAVDVLQAMDRMDRMA